MVTDNFGVKNVGEDNEKYLAAIPEDKYKLITDCVFQIYCDIKIMRNCYRRYVDI